MARNLVFLSTKNFNSKMSQFQAILTVNLTEFANSDQSFFKARVCVRIIS